jgi:hypothetical protein
MDINPTTVQLIGGILNGAGATLAAYLVFAAAIVGEVIEAAAVQAIKVRHAILSSAHDRASMIAAPLILAASSTMSG